jgi:hypothetical protein
MNHQELLKYAADRLDDLAEDDDEGTGLLAFTLRREAEVERWTADEILASVKKVGIPVYVNGLTDEAS